MASVTMQKRETIECPDCKINLGRVYPDLAVELGLRTDDFTYFIACDCIAPENSNPDRDRLTLLKMPVSKVDFEVVEFDKYGRITD